MSTIVLKTVNPNGLVRRGMVGAYAGDSTLANCDIIDMRGVAGGQFYAPAADTYTFMAGRDETHANFAAMYKSDGTTAVAPVVAQAGWVDFPPEVYGCSYLIIKPSAADRAMYVSLKT